MFASIGLGLGVAHGYGILWPADLFHQRCQLIVVGTLHHVMDQPGLSLIEDLEHLRYLSGALVVEETLKGDATRSLEILFTGPPSKPINKKDPLNEDEMGFPPKGIPHDFREGQRGVWFLTYDERLKAFRPVNVGPQGFRPISDLEKVREEFSPPPTLRQPSTQVILHPPLPPHQRRSLACQWIIKNILEEAGLRESIVKELLSAKSEEQFRSALRVAYGPKGLTLGIGYHTDQLASGSTFERLDFAYRSFFVSLEQKRQRYLAQGKILWLEEPSHPARHESNFSVGSLFQAANAVTLTRVLLGRAYNLATTEGYLTPAELERHLQTRFPDLFRSFQQVTDWPPRKHAFDEEQALQHRWISDLMAVWETNPSHQELVRVAKDRYAGEEFSHYARLPVGHMPGDQEGYTLDEILDRLQTDK